jgi:FdhD protein
VAENTKRVTLYQVNDGVRKKVETEVVRESTLAVVVNDIELAVLACSPSEPEYLAAGFVQSQVLIRKRSDIAGIDSSEAGIVRIKTRESIDVPGRLAVTSSGGRSSRVYDIRTVTESRITVPAERVSALMEEFDRYSRDFRRTGGVHSAALCDTEKMLVFSEDVGRHNAIDRVFGRCLLEDIPVEDLFLITSGRVSSDILMKAAVRNTPVLIARNSPTDLGIELAEKAGITLLGFVRDTSMNIYTHEWRIT